MDLAKEQLKTILNNCKNSNTDCANVKCVENYLKNAKNSYSKRKYIKSVVIIGALVYCVGLYFSELQSKRCSLELPRALRYAFRPPENCDFCRRVDQVMRVRGITSEEFARNFAYNGRPVIVEDATQNWTALTKFSYWYFRDVYQNSKRKQKVLDCQFLPYKTGFHNIFEALDMPEERVSLANGTKPWYFGWSNCNPETAEEFRKHYGRPYFLPKSSENNAVDWFFIGSAGLGAHMHIDNVRLPSWQAQLKGSKRWVLAPPPECFFECKQIDAVVRTGDIIVLDTNKWYHQTFVQPGEVSLTIGAEYD